MTREQLNAEIEKANEYLDEMLRGINVLTSNIIADKFGGDKRFSETIKIFEDGFGDFIEGATESLKPELIVNWSACGSQDAYTALRFAEALELISKNVMHYNRRRQQMFERLQGLSKHLTEEK